MQLAWSRYLAVLFAVGLGIGEAVMNWGHWQYAPLWVVDYVIVTWLIWAFVKTRSGGSVHILLSGWAFAAGVFYMALFISLDPSPASVSNVDPVVLALMGLLLTLSVVGFLSALAAVRCPPRAVLKSQHVESSRDGGERGRERA